MNPPSSDATPDELPADPRDSAGGSASVGGPFDWAALVPHVLHPDKVSIIEALLYIGVPLSATDLTKCFGGAGSGLSHVSYHVRSLAAVGVLTKVSERQARGAKETFYFFS